MIDLHEVAAEYVAVPIVARTPASVIVARGRKLRTRRRRRGVGTLVLLVAVPTLALATIRTRRESSVNVIAPSTTTGTGPPTTGAVPVTPRVLTPTGPADPTFINAVAAELPDGYRLHSSDSSIGETGQHFEEAIFTDQLSSVARASVSDIAPRGESFEQWLSTLGASPSGRLLNGYVPSGNPGIYLSTRNNSSGSDVVAKLTGDRVLIVSSSISLAHYGTTHPLSITFLVHAAADLAAKL